MVRKEADLQKNENRFERVKKSFITPKGPGKRRNQVELGGGGPSKNVGRTTTPLGGGGKTVAKGKKKNSGRRG